MDVSKRKLYIAEGNKTRVVVPNVLTGLALEKAFLALKEKRVLGRVVEDDVRAVFVKRARPDSPSAEPRRLLCSVPQPGEVLKMLWDISYRLHASGYVLIDAQRPEPGFGDHDLVLDVRPEPGARPQVGVLSCELKVRGEPANRALMRSDCSRLFQAACDRSPDWLGQLVVVAEVAADGCFLRSRAEYLPRGRRDEPVNLWGWPGRACQACPLAPVPMRNALAPASRPLAHASEPRRAPSVPAALPARAAKKPWSEVREELQKYEAPWSDEKVARLAQYLGKVHPSKDTHADRVIKENRRAPFSWRKGVHYDRAVSKPGGRVRQGGAKQPYAMASVVELARSLRSLA